MSLTPLQKIQRAHVALMRSPEFCLLSGIVMCGKYEIDDAMPTAATDGWNCIYGSEFIAGLADEREVNGIVAHENFHKMYRQLTVWRKLFEEDQRCANMASDYVINQHIVDCDPKQRIVKLPDGALLDPAYKGMNVKQVYDILRKQGQGSGEAGNSQNGAAGEPLDQHQWEKAQAVPGEEQAQRDAQIDQAIRQGLKLAADRGAGGNRALQELIEPKVNWREQLRDFVNATATGRDLSTWRKPNRRWLAQDVYMPSMYSETMGEIVVAIDTSGSIGGAELMEFVSELVSICETVSPEKLTLVWWDTAVHAPQEFMRGEYDGMVGALKLAGGGGTTAACIFEWLAAERKAPECVVVLTDGYVSGWGVAPSCPVLWAVTSDCVAPWGVTVCVE